MFRRFSDNTTILTIVVDCGLVSLALYIAASLRPSFNALPFTKSLPGPIEIPAALYMIFSVGWIAILLLFSVYDSRRNLKITDELTNLTLGSALAGIALAGVLYLSFREISRILFIFFVLLASVLLISWRITLRSIFRLRSHSLALRKVLIIGAGPVGQEVKEKIIANPYLGLEMIGFLDDNLRKRESVPDILGPLERTRDVVLKKKVDDVIIALPRHAHEIVNLLVEDLHNLPVKVWVIPDYFHLALHRASIEEFAGIPMLDLRAPAITDFQRLVKRMFDLLIAAFALLITIPMMTVIAVAIRLEGPGSVIFQQERVGENGRIFRMLKFRTMIPEAEELRYLVEYVDESGNFIHKAENDPRVTQIGHFLRRTSLDELPQIFNIIKGDMSLVGPRPEMPYMMSYYKSWQHSRFAVPQGLTGWWQVNGRSNRPMHLHTDDDLYYVQNYSLLLDVEILVKTIWAVLRGKGAF